MYLGESNPGLTHLPRFHPVFVSRMVCTSLSMVCSYRKFGTNLAMNYRIPVFRIHRMIYPARHPVHCLNHDEIFSWFDVAINVEYHE